MPLTAGREKGEGLESVLALIPPPGEFLCVVDKRAAFGSNLKVRRSEGSPDEVGLLVEVMGAGRITFRDVRPFSESGCCIREA